MNSLSNLSLSLESKKKIVLVFFIGGITMAEISAFRYLNKRNDDIEYVIVTTKLINGNNFLENLYGKFYLKFHNFFFKPIKK